MVSRYHDLYVPFDVALAIDRDSDRTLDLHAVVHGSVCSRRQVKGARWNRTHCVRNHAFPCLDATTHVPRHRHLHTTLSTLHAHVPPDSSSTSSRRHGCFFPPLCSIVLLPSRMDRPRTVGLDPIDLVASDPPPRG